MCRWPRKLCLLQEAFSVRTAILPQLLQSQLGSCTVLGRLRRVSSKDLQHMRLTTQKYHFNRLKPSNTDKLHLDLTLTLSTLGL